jgi:V-type H+-transporting ATPase subunit A
MCHEKLVGTIISLEHNPAPIQFSEEPLEICQLAAEALRPSGLGVIDNISDGIKRPLKDISGQTGSVFIPCRVDSNALDQKRLLLFVAVRSGSDVISVINESSLIKQKARW